MTGGRLGQVVAELQRVVGQLEDVALEAADYPASDRGQLSGALTDLAVRLELARIEVLGAQVLSEGHHGRGG